MNTALVLEGGAMRGMFSCGVIDVFMENGIDFDTCVGVSAGAVFGCNLKSRQIGRAIRYNKRFCRDLRYGTLLSYLRTGDIYDADLCYKKIPDEYDPFDREAIKSNPMHFYIGTTDVMTGKPVFHECTDGMETDIEWFRASASMPLVSRAVEINDRRFLDGGIADPIPYRFAEQKGCERLVVILTRENGFRKKKFRFLPVMRIMMKKYPALIYAMERQHRVYNAQLDAISRRERNGTALVIRPPAPLGIKRTEHSPEKLEQVYQLGRKTALEMLDEVKAFIQ